MASILSVVIALVAISGSIALSAKAQCPPCPEGELFKFDSGCEVPVYDTPEGLTRIRDIQSSAFSSPLEGQIITTVGVLTAIRSNGFFIQDVYEDCDETTSEGIFVFRPPENSEYAVGKAVTVTGTVTEFVFTNSFGERDGLVLTELTSISDAFIVSDGPITVNTREFRPPRRLSRFGAYVFDVDETNQTSILDFTCPDLNDAYCTYEAYEGMLVRMSTPTSSGATQRFGEIAVTNGNTRAPRLNSYGGVILTPGSVRRGFPGEVVLVEDALADVPYFPIGTDLAPMDGVIHFSFGHAKFWPLLDVVAAGEIVDPSIPVCTAVDNEANLRVGSFNMRNYCAGDSRLADLVETMATSMDCPHVIGLQEVGDDTCFTGSDGITSAREGLIEIVSQLNSLCPDKVYRFLEVEPEEGNDGGAPGLNIRVAVVYDVQKLAFERRVIDGVDPSAVATEFVNSQLTLNPGRIAPQDPAFDRSRKPIVVEFEHFDKLIYVVVHHWNSKGSDDALFYELAPPRQNSQDQRNDIQEAVTAFFSTLPKQAAIFSVGDFNDFYFSKPLVESKRLPNRPNLQNMWLTFPKTERYSYYFQGRFQTLDHIFVRRRDVPSCALCVFHGSSLTGANQVSDHDPLVVECNGYPGDAGILETMTPIPSASPTASPLPTPSSGPATRIEVDATVFINEFHYDNAGGDAGEFIEIAAPEGTDLSGYQLVLYNGANGAVYDTEILSGVVSSGDIVSGYGFAVYEIAGIQNGAPDGIALLDPEGEALQFISYEGELVAVSGPLAGFTSTDVGVSESGSGTGTSIGLQGAGMSLFDFTYVLFDADSRDEVNEGQTFEDIISTTTPGPTASLTPTAAPTPTPTESSMPTIRVEVDANVFINEFHYDNAGADEGEFIEIAAPAGTDLSGYQILLYNGANGGVYDTESLSGTIPDIDVAYGFAVFDIPGIQNGAPDAIALLDPSGTPLQFISYEGELVATSGPLVGFTSNDVGVSESGNAAGTSIGLQGRGSSLLDFSYVLFANNSPGESNEGQNILSPPLTR